MTPANPEFPPAFVGHALMPDDDPLARAVDGAADCRLGAGDLLWLMDTETAAAAFVLEPDVELLTALEMVPVLMVAIGDAVGSVVPPNLAITYRWPGDILANGARVGEVRAAASTRQADEVPDWLVVAFSLHLTEASNAEAEPGRQPERTALHLEGAGDIDRTMLVEAVARHFLSWIDGWQADGFKPVHQMWEGRRSDDLPFASFGDRAPAEGEVFLGLDEHGGLLTKQNGKVRSASLVDGMLSQPVEAELHAG